MNTRQQDIVTLLKNQGEISIKALAQMLSVSEMTIHRDLDFLEEQRFLYKKRGAAVFVDNNDRKTTDFYSAEKSIIGKKAAELITQGQSVIFDNSTTAFECARFLNKITNCTFYTTNLEIARILSDFKNNLLYSSGGYYFADSKGFVGKQAEDFVENITADICIIGASGIDLNGGITTPYPMHTALQKKIIKSAKKTILLADHSKFGKAAMEKVCDISNIDLIITDKGISENILKEYSTLTQIITV